MAASPPSVPAEEWHASSRGPRRRIIGLALLGVFVLAVAGIGVMLHYWPFRYREVHPLLEHTFRSKVVVKRYHRTYFPHPGYVAEGVTFYRHGDMQIPPLASLERMTVVGTWTNLIFHPHQLFEIRLAGLHVQIPPPGTKARGRDFDQGMVAPSEHSIEIETIVADGTTLDFLAGGGKPPLRFQFPLLQIHNVHQGQPLSFFARVLNSRPRGTIFANGSVGPFRTNAYGETPLSGTYSLENADLSTVAGISGHGQASGRYSGTFAAIQTVGKATIPDFRAASAHRVRLDAAYQVVVNGTNGDATIRDAQVRAGSNLITASGSVTGKPNQVKFTIATTGSRVEDLLRIVEHDEPSVAGKVTFHAAGELNNGSGPFLQRLGLKGQISLAEIRFTKPDTQQKMDAFSARVQKDPPRDAKGDPALVTAAVSSPTIFRDGMAYFPDIHITFPGTQAYLHGTFNLLDTHVHLTGKVDLQQDISHAVTGVKSALLKPVAPFFHHRDVGAIVSIAVTGTASQPKIAQDMLHKK